MGDRVASSGAEIPRCLSPAAGPLDIAALRRPQAGSVVHLAIDGQYRGSFELTHALRPDADKLMAGLSGQYRLTLLSGDNERDRTRLERVFGRRAQLHFNQSPLDKLKFIQQLQQAGRKVVMVGDGLNDAGALRQSDVGIAVVENLGAFSPASDIIMSAEMLPHLHEIAEFSRSAVRVVRVSFALSAVYNAVGIGIGACALLSPVICAVLMPLSSVTVVLFACGATGWLARRRFG